MFQRISITFIITVCLGFYGCTQSLEQDFESIMRQMETASSVSINVSVKVYAQKGGSVVHSTTASVEKNGKNVKSVLGELEIITTPEYDLKIDHEEKAVLILKRDSVKSETLTELGELDLKKLKKFFEENATSADDSKPEIKLLSNANGEKKYAISNIQGVVEMQVHLNTNKNKLQKITYEYGNSGSKGQYVVLNYSKFQYNVDQTSTFDLTKYFTVKNGKYVLSAQLEEYKIYTER